MHLNNYAVELNGYCTPWFTVGNGVKQGCLLSPSLFNLYINDLLLTLTVVGPNTELIVGLLTFLH